MLLEVREEVRAASLQIHIELKKHNHLRNQVRKSLRLRYIILPGVNTSYLNPENIFLILSPLRRIGYTDPEKSSHASRQRKRKGLV